MSYSRFFSLEGYDNQDDWQLIYNETTHEVVFNGKTWKWKLMLAENFCLTEIKLHNPPTWCAQS